MVTTKPQTILPKRLKAQQRNSGGHHRTLEGGTQNAAQLAQRLP